MACLDISKILNENSEQEDNNLANNEDIDQFKNISVDEKQSLLNNSASSIDARKYRRRRSGGKHQMAACCACKKKRKKCDGKYPICSSCEKHGKECTILYAPTGREIRRDYLDQLESFLERRENYIKELEFKLHMHDSERKTFSPLVSGSLNDTTDSDSPPKYPPTVNLNKDLAEDVGYISLGAAGEPCYIGETSAYSLAKVINSSINCFPLSKTKILDLKVEEFSSLPFRFPSKETVNRLISCYRKTVHCQYPFLDWTFVEKCVEKVIKRKEKDPISNYFLFMILAIGSQIEASTNTTIFLSYTKSYYLKAFETVSTVVESITHQTVQAYLLMAIFSQKMPDGVSGWQATGLAIRTAVVLGLHRKPYYRNNESVSNEQRQLQDLKSRIFWSAYGIERISGLVLGRPFCISDVDIDAPFPIETQDTNVACHLVKLRRIQSSICSFIYKPLHLMGEAEDLDSTRIEILLELNEWMTTFPYKHNPLSAFETDDWSVISYHNSVIILLRPIILEISRLKENSPTRYLEWFKMFTESASAVCINFKNMYLKKKLSYTWLALHFCFVSGISFLYCIWLDRTLHVLRWKRKSLIYETIDACQTSLYVLAERWDSASRFRDWFEKLSNIVKVSVDPQVENESHTGTTNLINSSVFVDERLELDLFLQNRVAKNKNKMGISGETGSITSPNASLNLDTKNINDFTLESLAEFLDSTGDNYLKDLFYEMEDNMSLYD